MRGDCVGESARLFDTHETVEDLCRDLLIQLHELIELTQNRSPERLDLGPLRGLRGHRRTARCEIGALVFDLKYPGPLRAFDKNLHRSVGQFQHLQDAGHTANLINVSCRGIILSSTLLCRQENMLASLHCDFHRLNRLRATHEERDHHVRKDHHIAQWQHG